MLRTTIKGLLAHKVRVAATGLAVLLGVAFLAGTLVLTDTVRATLKDLYAGVYAGTDAYVRAEEAFPSHRGPQRPRLDAPLVETVAAVGGVAVAEGRIHGYAQLLDRQGRAQRPPGGPGSNVHGSPGARPDSALHATAWSPHDRLNPFRLVAGRAPGADDEVVLDRRSARTAGYGPGDRATVLVQGEPRQVSIVGIAALSRADSPGGSSYVFFTPEAAERLLTPAGKVDAVAVAAEPGVDAGELRDRIAAVLPAGVEVLTGAQLVAEGSEASRGVVEAWGKFLTAFAVVALFVGAFLIHNTFTILVAQRGREAALLRAVGASRRQVLTSVLVEALAVGAVASLLGMLVGTGMAAALRALMGAFGFDIPAGPLAVSARTLVVAGLVGVAVTVVSALLPARRAAAIPPVAAFRDAEVDPSAGSRRRLVTGALLLASGGAFLFVGLFAAGGSLPPVALGAALIFVGVAALGPVATPTLVRLLGAPLRALGGVPGRLAVENAARNPRRTSGAAAALMIGVGLVSLIGIVASSAEASMDRREAKGAQVEKARAGIAVEPLAHGVGGVTPALARRLSELPEVAEVTGVRMGIAAVEGEAILDLVAVDPAAYERLASPGIVEGSLAALDDDGIAVAESLARQRGWSVGDSLRVRFAETGERTFRVAALYSRGLGSYLVSIPVFEANVADQLDVRVYVQPAPGVSDEEAGRAVTSVTRAYGIPSVQRPVDARTVRSAATDGTVDMVYVLLGLAVLIALLGIGNTLSLSVLERTRELGLLRAVGMSRAQLRSMVRYESVLIALLGTVLGVVLGLFFAWAAAEAVPDEDVRLRIPHVRLAVMAVLAGGAALLAAVLPARRAANLDVLDAVTTE